LRLSRELPGREFADSLFASPVVALLATAAQRADASAPLPQRRPGPHPPASPWAAPSVTIGRMSDVSLLLDAAAAGDRQAAAELLPLVYDELRKLAAARMAAEGLGQTLQATALVHEAYLRLVGDQQFDGRGHFFAAAAEAMRRILVNHARDGKR